DLGTRRGRDPGFGLLIVRRGRRGVPPWTGRCRGRRADAWWRALRSRRRSGKTVAARPRRRDRSHHAQRRPDPPTPGVTMTAMATAPAAYFTVLLDQAKEDLARRGLPIFDFGVGDPIEPTPAFIRQALIDALDPVSQYPTIVGQRRLRQAIAGW